MAETFGFPADVTSSEAPTPPAAPEAPAAGAEKALADTKAELTRVQQELAALKKGQTSDAPSSADPSVAPGTGAPAEPPSGDVTPGAEGAPEQDAAKEAVASAGLDVSSWQTEFDTTGDVSEDGRAKIAEGLKSMFGEQARDLVDKFIDGRKAAFTQETAVYYDAAGGQENYGKISEWAKANMTPAELGAYNNILQTGDKDAALVAIKGLRARYEGVAGYEPTLINSGGAAQAAPAGFRSKQEMVSAMSDHRYQTDPAYRDDVLAKLAKSNF